jgi:two-component system sensor kinase FixL
MNWVELAWAMMASAALTLALVHLLVWRKQRSQYAYLWFFALATSVAACAAFELSLMRATTPAGYATTLRWAQVPVSLTFCSIVGFGYFYLDAGRAWLALATCFIRLLVLTLNFTTGVNIYFADISTLQRVSVWGGGGYSVPVGTPNPWWILAQVGNVLLVAFIVEAATTLWRRGDPVLRRRALLVGGGLLLAFVVSVTAALLTFLGHARTPTIVAPAFLIIAVAMGYELGEEALRTAQLSRELSNSERRSELAAQAGNLALWSWNPMSNELWMNAIGRTLFGFPLEARLDLETLLRAVHAEDREGMRGLMEETVRNGGHFEREYRISVPGSPTRWIVTRGQVEQDQDPSGGVLLRGVTVDISERRRIEHEVTQQRTELAHLSRVAALGEMAGALAHEINQPLMAILSNARAAQRFMAGDNADLFEVRAILADIVADDKRAGEVIHRLRGLLRRGEVQRGPFDLNSLIEDVLRLTRNELLNRGVVATVELAPDLPSLLGDSIQIQQVLLNLVMNACDAMEGTPGSRQLVLRTRTMDGAGVEVSVSDCGCGIRPGELERIFEPFVTTKKHGMGLGLSVCRTIVAAHGGRLWAESVDGCGATLRFALPVATEQL